MSPRATNGTSSADAPAVTGVADQDWANRTNFLHGKWVTVGAYGYVLIPGASGAWPATGRKVPAGTRAFVSGVVASDGAIMVNVPIRSETGEAAGMEQLWLRHDAVTLAEQPRLNPVGDPTGTSSSQRHAMKDLGTLQEFGSGFYGTAGSALETLVPTIGKEAALQLNVNLPVSPGTSIAFQFVMDAERTDAGYQARCDVSVGVLAKADLWLVEAFAKASMFGYLEAQGDSGAEIFRLFSLALCERVRNHSERAANLVWGEGFRDQTVGGMDADDYSESGLGVEVQAGLQGPSGLDGSGDDVTGGYRYSNGTRLVANGSGDLAEEDVSMHEIELALSVGKLDGALEVAWGQHDGTSRGRLSLSGTRMTDFTELGGRAADGSFVLNPADVAAVLGAWVTGVISQARSLVKNHDKLSKSAAQKAGQILDAVSGISLGGHLASAAVLGRLKALQSLGIGIGQRLDIGGEWRGDSTQVSLSLSRTSQIEVGENPRAPVYALAETMVPIVAIDNSVKSGATRGAAANDVAEQSAGAKNSSVGQWIAGGISSVADALGAPRLSRGSEGQRVSDLQKELVRLGLMTEAEVATGPGIFGPKTERAVLAAQARLGVNPTGVVDGIFFAVLKSVSALPAPRGDATGDRQYGRGNPFFSRWGGADRHGTGVPGGQCTWFARAMRSDLGNACLGDARTWAGSARSAGFPVGPDARPGAVAVSGNGTWGHVMFVTSVDSTGGFSVEESNYGLDERIGTRSVAAGKRNDYQFIYRKGE